MSFLKLTASSLAIAAVSATAAAARDQIRIVGSSTVFPFATAVAEQFGSVDAWIEDFKNCGKSRGIGWAIAYYDTATGQINNHFIQLHEDGHIAGFAPLAIMDCFEHAWMVDHGAGGRGAYIDAVVENLNWEVLDQRTQAAQEGKIWKRF